jgi:hypothetical protein
MASAEQIAIAQERRDQELLDRLANIEATQQQILALLNGATPTVNVAVETPVVTDGETSSTGEDAGTDKAANPADENPVADEAADSDGGEATAEAGEAVGSDTGKSRNKR